MISLVLLLVRAAGVGVACYLTTEGNLVATAVLLGLLWVHLEMLGVSTYSNSRMLKIMNSPTVQALRRQRDVN